MQTFYYFIKILAPISQNRPQSQLG